MQSYRFFPEKKDRGGKLVSGLIEMMLDIKTYRKSEKLKCLEIGSHIGESALIMASFPFVEKFYCIENDETKIETLSNRLFYFGNKVEICNKDAEKCVNMFTYRSIDMIYIDAIHDYEHTKNFLKLYLSKIKIGGFICGHDYFFEPNITGVKQAVDEFMEEYRYRKLKTYIDGSFCITKGNK